MKDRGARMSRFAAVGLAATGLYAAFAFLLSSFMSATLASVCAYGVAAIFSYLGHKSLTFASNGAHGVEAPRFLTLTVTGVAISWALPFLLSDRLQMPALVPIVATCLFIPVFNYVVLDRWVFRGAH